VKKLDVKKSVEQPKGDVIRVTGPSLRNRLMDLMNLARRDYTVRELRQAARFPMISAIINTIAREVEAYQLVIEEKEPGNEEAAKKLRKHLVRPNKFDNSLRIFFDGMMRDILIPGWANVEWLRNKKGQATAEKAVKYFVNGRISSDFFSWIEKVRKQPGEILGFICRDAGGIYMDGLNGFYDVGDVDMYSLALTPARKAELTHWTPEQMTRVFFSGTTEKEKRLPQVL